MSCFESFIMASSIIPMSLQEPVKRTWRVNRLMSSSRSFKRDVVVIRDVVSPFLLLVAVNLILITTWSIVNPLRYMRTPAQNSSGTFRRFNASYGSCASENQTSDFIFYSIYFLIVLLALAFANYQNYVARNVQQDYNEFLSAARSLALMAECLLLGLPALAVVTINADPSANFVVRAVMVSILCLCILLPRFVPSKFAQRHLKRRKTIRRMKRVSVRLPYRSRAQSTADGGCSSKLSFRSLPGEQLFSSLAMSFSRPSQQSSTETLPCEAFRGATSAFFDTSAALFAVAEEVKEEEI